MDRSPQGYTKTSPTGEAFEYLKVYLPKGLKRQFAEAARRNGHSMSWVVTEAVRAYVEQSGAQS